MLVLLVNTVLMIVQSRRETHLRQGRIAPLGRANLSPGAWDDRLPVQLLLIVTGLSWALVFGSEYILVGGFRGRCDLNFRHRFLSRISRLPPASPQSS